jgi:hypothetical protein
MRSQKNNTDGIWFWIAPESLSDLVPPVTGNRQHWVMKQITLDIPVLGNTTVWIGKQDSLVGGWRAHWMHQHYSYHIYVRPSLTFSLHKLQQFIYSFSTM